MDVLIKKIIFFTILCFLSSCAKLGYVVEQGVGQYSLFSASRPNSVVLEDEKVSTEIKEKIRLIEESKSYFYKYWGHSETRIYERTTILDRDAVNYLVIASPYNEIKAKQNCFWFMGCFPYLGFFSENSAYEHVENLKSEGWETYIRPVYAYSTLGYLNDRILSSFFAYEGEDLIELVFHELYHTIFFIKDEVDLNENLAQFIGEKMAIEYLDLNESDVRNKNEKRRQLNEKIYELTQKLQERYQESPGLSDEKAREILESFLKETFKPEIKKLCELQQRSKRACFALQDDWNNARFAAFLTYQKESKKLSKLYKENGKDLKKMQLYIESKYQQYKKSDYEGLFETYLFL